MKSKLLNELPRLAFEFFLAAHGAEVVCLSLKGYFEFCCFFVKDSTTHIISQSIVPAFFDERTI